MSILNLSDSFRFIPTNSSKHVSVFPFFLRLVEHVNSWRFG
jgi:hypothetical protein